MADFDKKKDDALLKRVQQDPVWDVLMRRLRIKIDKLNEDRPTGTNAFETLRALHVNQGKVDGLKEFFEEIERGAFE